MLPSVRSRIQVDSGYPRVRFLSFERLPIPESVDIMSLAAARHEMLRRRNKTTGEAGTSGINLTPAIANACETSEVQNYLASLDALVGQELLPRDLRPKLAADGPLRWAYPIANTGIYLSLGEADEAQSEDRVAEVQLHCAGPNLGSAGGPTLQPLGAIARIRYRGILLQQIRHPDRNPKTQRTRRPAWLKPREAQIEI